MTNITTINFQKKVEPITEKTNDDVAEEVKYARMSFDQVTDMHAEELLIPISLQEHYKPILEFYPGFKYIKIHLPMFLMNGIKI